VVAPCWSVRLLLKRTLPVVVAMAVLGPAAATAAPLRLSLASPRLAAPRSARIGTGPLLIQDSKLSTRAARAIATGPSWGGTYTTPSGVSLQILVSPAYPEDPALPQKWADFLDTLVHGNELAELTMYLAPIAEVEVQCGPQALACYSASQSLLIAPAEEVEAGVTPEAVVTHEYGHHIAAHRSNAPWTAIETGTKRWASYLQVCAKADTGTLFPGAEDFSHYQLNPGEGFAEQYRVLNQRRVGLPETAWDVVAQSLYPDDTSLQLLEQDIVSPWQGTALTHITAPIGASAWKRSYTVGTGLDGNLKVTLRAPAKSKLSLDLYAGASRVGHAQTTLTSRTKTVTASVCGTRSYRIVVGRVAGGGTFALTVSKP
jgi:hypothetical protein